MLRDWRIGEARRLSSRQATSDMYSYMYFGVTRWAWPITIRRMRAKKDSAWLLFTPSPVENSIEWLTVRCWNLAMYSPYAGCSSVMTVAFLLMYFLASAAPWVSLRREPLAPRFGLRQHLASSTPPAGPSRFACLDERRSHLQERGPGPGSYWPSLFTRGLRTRPDRWAPSTCTKPSRGLVLLSSSCS